MGILDWFFSLFGADDENSKEKTETEELKHEAQILERENIVLKKQRDDEIREQNLRIKSLNEAIAIWEKPRKTDMLQFEKNRYKIENSLSHRDEMEHAKKKMTDEANAKIEHNNRRILELGRKIEINEAKVRKERMSKQITK